METEKNKPSTDVWRFENQCRWFLAQPALLSALHRPPPIKRGRPRARSNKVYLTKEEVHGLVLSYLRQPATLL